MNDWLFRLRYLWEYETHRSTKNKTYKKRLNFMLPLLLLLKWLALSILPSLQQRSISNVEDISCCCCLVLHIVDLLSLEYLAKPDVLKLSFCHLFLGGLKNNPTTKTVNKRQRCHWENGLRDPHTGYRTGHWGTVPVGQLAQSCAHAHTHTRLTVLGDL